MLFEFFLRENNAYVGFCNILNFLRQQWWKVDVLLRNSQSGYQSTEPDKKFPFFFYFFYHCFYFIFFFLSQYLLTQFSYHQSLPIFCYLVVLYFFTGFLFCTHFQHTHTTTFCLLCLTFSVFLFLSFTNKHFSSYYLCHHFLLP